MRAFTLIETMLYLGIFSILSIGTLEGVTLFEASATRNQVRALLYSEGLFTEEKILYEIAENQPLTVPLGNQINLIDLVVATSTEMIGTSSAERVQISFIAQATSTNGSLLEEPFEIVTYRTP